MVKYVVCLCRGGGVIHVLLSVRIVRRGAVQVLAYRKYECYRHAPVVCMCLVCILWAVLSDAFCMTCSSFMLGKEFCLFSSRFDTV